MLISEFLVVDELLKHTMAPQGKQGSRQQLRERETFVNLLTKTENYCYSKRNKNTNKRVIWH